MVHQCKGERELSHDRYDRVDRPRHSKTALTPETGTERCHKEGRDVTCRDKVHLSPCQKWFLKILYLSCNFAAVYTSIIFKLKI